MDFFRVQTHQRRWLLQVSTEWSQDSPGSSADRFGLRNRDANYRNPPLLLQHWLLPHRRNLHGTAPYSAVALLNQGPKSLVGSDLPLLKMPTSLAMRGRIVQRSS